MKIRFLILVLTFLIFITSSFDVFFNIHIFGFSLRIVFLLIILLILAATLYGLRTKEKLKIQFLGAQHMFVWVCFLIVFIPNTTILYRNIAYIIWLIFYLIFIAILPIVFKEVDVFLKIVKLYLLSFRVLCVCGILQFILGLMKINVLIAQYWVNGVPRVNGFCYEPSYYATYLLIGWVISFVMIIKKSALNNELKVKSTLILTSISIFLSGSRMGLLFIFIVVAAYILYSSKDIFLRFKIKRNALYQALGLVVIVFSAVLYFSYHFDQAKVYLNGLGLMGTVSHSTTIRSSDFQATMQVFYKHPVMGRSLGGIPSAIAEVRGFKITTQQETKKVEGLNIFAEVLAASGIFGFIFFLLFLYIFFRNNYRLSQMVASFNKDYSDLMTALLWSLFLELAILTLSQNVLRAYLWIHIAILNLGFFTMKNYLLKQNQ